MKETSGKKVVIAGADPAGLTAAYELAKSTDFDITVIERDIQVGGISKTVNYKNNRIDIGGHRFFSKSDTVMNWWTQVLPMQDAKTNPDKTDEVMLIRSRKSRILWMRKLFDYPLKLSLNTIFKLGLWRVFLIGISYMAALIHPIRPEENLEQFFINRFGKRLYKQFFKDYTEKVWGVPCSQISSSWGAQRIKGISITKAITHALKSALLPKKKNDISQKSVETSLIESFLYPKYGPGQLWECVAKECITRGVKIRLCTELDGIQCGNGGITSVTVHDAQKQADRLDCDFFISSMPIKELVGKLNGIEIPKEILEISEGLAYRDFITVGLLCESINLKERDGNTVKDNWIYIQESDVKVGRLQIFNNWSPYMVSDKRKTWIGLEYFCQEGDHLWSMPDKDFISLAKHEMQSCGIIGDGSVSDATVIRVKKAYPAYFGTYNRFGEVRLFLDKIKNLYCVGRNGQHRYNNMDHSMLSSIEACKNIIAGNMDKANIWAVNTEEEYHEAK